MDPYFNIQNLNLKKHRQGWMVKFYLLQQYKINNGESISYVPLIAELTELLPLTQYRYLSFVRPFSPVPAN